MTVTNGFARSGFGWSVLDRDGGGAVFIPGFGNPAAMLDGIPIYRSRDEARSLARVLTARGYNMRVARMFVSLQEQLCK